MKKDNKIQIQNDILDFIDDYIKQTPKEVIQKDISSISKLDFPGTSAREYFDNFNSYYNNLEEYTSKKAEEKHDVDLDNAPKEYTEKTVALMLWDYPYNKLYKNEHKAEKSLLSNEFNIIDDLPNYRNIQTVNYQYV